MSKLNSKAATAAFTVLCSIATGSLAAVVAVVYKFLAQKAISLSSLLYSSLKYLPVLVLLMLLLSVLLPRIYRKAPQLQGGGIPAAISAVRGLRPLPWLQNTAGPFFLSLFSFVLGVPLGNEGPTVQFSTAVGGGLSRLTKNKHPDTKSLVLSAGAAAGFAVATGAPAAGLLFVLEEAHRKISPSILLSSGISVLCATLVSRFLSPLFGVEAALFSPVSLSALSLREMWLPAVVGLCMGLFAAAFMAFHLLLKKLHKKVSVKIPQGVLILFVFVMTLTCGFLMPEGISTGHHLITELLQETPALWLLLLLVAVRTILTLSANTVGLTGGIFLPQLAIAAALSAFLGLLLVQLGIPRDYLTLVVVLGLCGCVAGMMKMPFTAIVFSLEALGLWQNPLPVLLTAGLSYLIPKLLKLPSICDYVLEQMEKEA